MGIENIKKVLTKEENKKLTYKTVTFQLEEEYVSALGKINEEFNKISTTKFTRNSMLTDAVINYIEDATALLISDYGVDINNPDNECKSTVSNKNDEDYDTVILPAKKENYEKLVLEEHAWYAVRLADWRIKNIKYLCLYLVRPDCEIRYYMKVSKIEQYQDSDKKILYVSEPQPLPKSVKLGGANGNSMRGPRYAKLENIKAASTINELLNNK